MRVGNVATFVSVSIILFVHAFLLLWIGCSKTPNIDEIGHLSAGLSHWELGDYTLYRVNPPLVRMVAALPVVFSDAERDWQHLFKKEWHGRREWVVGEDFVDANAEHAFRLFVWARWACVPLSLIGGLLCFRWAYVLYGLSAGYVALVLWCFSPIIFGNAALITPDIGAASFGVLASLFFWRWLRQPNWQGAITSGVILGIAELAKTTLIIFYPLWLILLMVWRVSDASNSKSPKNYQVVFQFLLTVAISLMVLNAGYGFKQWGQRLANYHFVSYTLGGPYSSDNQQFGQRNRFANTILADLRIPLPSDYVLGIDMQKLNFEQGIWSYLRGAWRLGGWWYYYLYALAVKVPLGTWCLVGLAVGVTIFGRGFNAPWRDEMVVLVPGLVILAFVSSQTGFSVHSRYVIPVLPFFFIWISKVARVFEMRPLTQKRKALAAMVVVALTWSVTSSLWAYPHSLSYFNELAGGPKGGGGHLLDSNIDWGQDLLYLTNWLDEHPDVKLDGLAFHGSYPATLAGIPETPHPPPGPKPGWYAVSVNYLYSRDRQYRYFLDHFEPAASAGYSIYIYHITLDDANRVRRELGLPEIEQEIGKQDG